MPDCENVDRVDQRSSRAELVSAMTRPISRWNAPALDRGKPIVIMIVLMLVWILGFYWRTTLSMLSIWARSDTFAHGFLVVPIFLYLLWRQRVILAEIEPRPFFPALLGIAAAGIVWLVGEIVNAVSIAQFAMISMIPLSVWGLLGTRMAKDLAIPLAFLLFAVPFGEFLLPTLMDWTADFTVFAIGASGVPVYREGNFFTIPTGQWSVVEACSGLRYLIASFMIGCIFAYLSYRSTARRLAFIAISLIVPIIANWLRAYMIVMVGHLTNNRWAVGVDHLIYGWVFFGVVMLLLYWIGSRWREDEVVAAPTVMGYPTRLGSLHFNRPLQSALVGACALTAVWPLLHAYMEPPVNYKSIDLAPMASQNGWEGVSEEVSSWRPDISGAGATLRQTFAKGESRVGVHVAYFRDQTRYAKSIRSENQIVQPTNTQWRQVSQAIATFGLAGTPYKARAAIVADDRDRLAIWQWFWVDGHVTSNEYMAKLYELLSVIRGHGDPSAWVILYTSAKKDDAHAQQVLQSFIADMQGSIDDSLRNAASK